MRRAVFLDRDGTLVREAGYLTRTSELRLMPGAAAALARISARGFALVLATNQSAVARGLLTLPTLEALHGDLARRLRRRGVHLDAIYVCPHHPRIGSKAFRRRCSCRKPLPGLFRRAARDLGLDLSRSFAVGDSLRDVEAALRAGARPILVRTGHGKRDEATVRRRQAGVPVVADLDSAARLIAADQP